VHFCAFPGQGRRRLYHARSGERREDGCGGQLLQKGDV
jgi:hypothetical protein